MTGPIKISVPIIAHLELKLQGFKQSKLYSYSAAADRMLEQLDPFAPEINLLCSRDCLLKSATAATGSMRKAIEKKRNKS